MTRKSIALTASLLSAAAIAPSAALAADAKLGGAPQMFQIDSTHATLKFAAERLPRKGSGRIDARVLVSGKRVAKLKATGRHGSDVVYQARVNAGRELRAGTKYTVTFKFGDQDSIVRKVKLHAAS